jgi:hypothetical protein
VSLVYNERAKLTANYLNGAAGSFFAAGVVAPLAAAVFGLAGPGTPVSTLTLALGVLIFFAVSIGLHFAPRYVLKSLKS